MVNLALLAFCPPVAGILVSEMARVNERIVQREPTGGAKRHTNASEVSALLGAIGSGATLGVETAATSDVAAGWACAATGAQTVSRAKIGVNFMDY